MSAFRPHLAGRAIVRPTTRQAVGDAKLAGWESAADGHQRRVSRAIALVGELDDGGLHDLGLRLVVTLSLGLTDSRARPASVSRACRTFPLSHKQRTAAGHVAWRTKRYQAA